MSIMDIMEEYDWFMVCTAAKCDSGVIQGLALPSLLSSPDHRPNWRILIRTFLSLS